MATQLFTYEGMNWLGNTAAPEAGTTLTYSFSTQAYGTFTISDTYATRQEITYWTGGTKLTQAVAAYVNGLSTGTPILWSTGASTDGPAAILTGLVMVGTSFLLCVVDICTLAGTTPFVMSVAGHSISWTPTFLYQNVP